MRTRRLAAVFSSRLLLVAALFAPAASTASAQTAFETLHAFTGDSQPVLPNVLVQARDGRFYGTTFAGGAFRHGTVFRLNGDGTHSILHAFRWTETGAYPSRIIEASDGNFYGTTSSGPGNGGSVFRITPTGVFATLHAFGNFEGPSGGLVQGVDGYLYGTTTGGGTHGRGTVFRITLDGGLTTLHSFSGRRPGDVAGAGADGAEPTARLVQASDGHFYGTTRFGGAHGGGTIFRITATGVLTILHGFPAGSDPRSAPELGADSHLYGTTAGNGGTLYRLTLGGFFSTIRSFVSGATFEAQDGIPSGELVRGPGGTLWGVTTGGGLVRGVLYRFTPPATFEIVSRFTDGVPEDAPRGPLLLAGDGNFYGSRRQAVFRLSPSGDRSIAHAFEPDQGGGDPMGGLVRMPDGAVWRTASGGSSSGLPCNGTVFRVSAGGAFARIHDFGRTNGDVCWPRGLARGGDGRLYGVASSDYYAPTRRTVAFAIAPDGSYEEVHTFDPALGSRPWELTPGPDGALYGSTGPVLRISGGGPYATTVFRLETDGTIRTLHVFTDPPDGFGQASGLVVSQDGTVYGTTEYGGTHDLGVAFRIGPDGTFQVLHHFDGRIIRGDPEVTTGNPRGGARPFGPLVLAEDGAILGTTREGGAFARGTIYQIRADGRFDLLHSFDPATDGGSPEDGLLLGADGHLYGMAQGGPRGRGTIFRLAFGAIFTVLRAFSAMDGGIPGRLLDGKDGYLYGHQTLGYLAAWQVEQGAMVSAVALTPARVTDPDWKVMGTADFNGDGQLDLFWQHRVTRIMTVWLMNGSQFAGASPVRQAPLPDAGWELRAIADMNGDGKPDLVWQHAVECRLSVWFMDGTTFLAGPPIWPYLVSDRGWRIAGAADFDGDGHTDLLWQHAGTLRLGCGSCTSTSCARAPRRRASRCPIPAGGCGRSSTWTATAGPTSCGSTHRQARSQPGSRTASFTVRPSL